MNINPATVASARTARLVREAQTPLYTSETGVYTQTERDLIQQAEDNACTEDFCFVCGRCTDHWGEHSEAQLLSWAKYGRRR
jgi:hypothetical protein